MSAKDLIVCADDYGLTPGINAAVLQLAEQGKLNATSVLVDGQNLTMDSIEALLKLKYEKNFSIGLHINFTELLGPQQDPEIVAPINQHLLRSRFYDSAVSHKIAQEIERQFFTFQELFDQYPDFIDGHQHVHMLPCFFEALREFYKEHRLDHYEIWIRSLNRVHKLNAAKLPGASSVKNLVLRFATNKAQSKVFFFRKELLGVYNFDTTIEEYGSLWAHWLTQAEAYKKSSGRGAVIMVHPSTDNVAAELQNLDLGTAAYDDPIAPARLREFTFFTTW